MENNQNYIYLFVYLFLFSKKKYSMDRIKVSKAWREDQCEL